MVSAQIHMNPQAHVLAHAFKETIHEKKQLNLGTI